MKQGSRIVTLMGLVAVLLAGATVGVEAQTANSYNNYGYDSYASQMVRDHINQRRTAERYASRRHSKASGHSQRSHRTRHVRKHGRTRSAR